MKQTLALEGFIFMLRIIQFLFIFLCGSLLLAQPFYVGAGWEQHGELSYTAFGWTMNNAGDVNADGFNDMIVTAIDYSNPEATNGEEGKVFLYYGSATGLATTPAWQFESDNDSSVLGFSSDGGDLNGDGYSDIVVGALQLTDGEYNEGQIYLWYGSATGLNAGGPDWTLQMNQVYALLGSGVAMNGDVNNDGYNDLFVSAKMWDGGQTDEGKTWMYWGSASGPVAADWSWEANQEYAISGFPVNYAGDVNHDGFDDIVIGANQYDSIDIDDGLAVAFYGSETGLQTSPDWSMSSGQKKCNFGHWVDGAGDVNGDGYDDVVVSALLYESDSAEHNEGRIFVYYGSPSGLKHELAWYGEINQAEAQLGYSNSGAGDINGDGFSDIIGGAKYYSGGQENEGSAYVWFGSADGLETNYCWTSEGDQAFGYFGKTVGGDVDFNNDGYDDFMVSAYRYTDILEADGKGFVYYGAPRQTDFHYPTDSFCLIDDNPLPVIDGISGGYFYSDDAAVDSLTGALNIELSGAGVHYIYYAGTGFCSTGKFKLYILDTVGTENVFHYTDDTICITDENPPPIFVIPSSGYFSSPDGVVDGATGMINLAASGYGDITINYFATTYLGCEVIATITVFIDYDPSFYYEQDTFCLYDANPYPVIDDLDAGTFYSYDCELNTLSGKILLLATGSGGPFTIFYDSQSKCGVDSFSFYITTPDSAFANFHFDEDSFCLEDDNPIAFIDGATGGVFSSDAVINSETGTIDIGATGSGLFTVIYTVEDASGCEVSFAADIYIIPAADATFSYANDSLLLNGTVGICSVALTGGAFSVEPAGLVFSDANGTIDLAASTPGTYTIYYTIFNALCYSTDSLVITLLPNCIAPIAVSVSNIYADGATISWSGDAFWNTYTVYLLSATGSIINTYFTTDTTVDITGLEEHTVYQVYVTLFCSALANSSTDTISFETTFQSVSGVSQHTLSLTINPNPADYIITVAASVPMDNASVFIYDAEGVLVYKKQCDNVFTTMPINIASFTSGIYIVRIENTSTSGVAAFVINK